MLTVKEVAIYLRVSRATVWRWCQRGTIEAVRIGRNWRIHREAFEHFTNGVSLTMPKVDKTAIATEQSVSVKVCSEEISDA